MDSAIPMSHSAYRSGRIGIVLILAASFFFAETLPAVPQLVNFQGRVKVSGSPFDSGVAGREGQFKFALVDAAGDQTYWSNDGTSSAGGEPSAAVAPTVRRGLYSVLLGDATLPNMTVLPASVFADNDEVFVRVWFDDGINGSQRLVPDQRIAAVGYAIAAATVADGAITSEKLANDSVTSAKLADNAVGGDHLEPGAAASNLVSGGSGLVMSENDADPELLAAGLVKVGEVVIEPPQRTFWSKVDDPLADPELGYEASADFAAVWTGSLYLTWGGNASRDFPRDFFSLHSGGIYDPEMDIWTPMSNINTPTARNFHQAAWTGSEMVVWGGFEEPNGRREEVEVSDYLVTGGAYDPATDLWRSLATADVPVGRINHTMLWTGREVIVWGGENSAGLLNSGGLYDPATNSWRTMSEVGAPMPRLFHLVVWTGTEMVVWGGFDASGDPVNTGGRYNPTTNTWRLVSVVNAPRNRLDRSAVWTGSAMLFPGAAYDPVRDEWTELSILEGSNERSNTAIWTGTKMLVRGGRQGMYDPATDSWEPLPIDYGYGPAFWTGSAVISRWVDSARSGGATTRFGKSVSVFRKP